MTKNFSQQPRDKTYPLAKSSAFFLNQFDIVQHQRQKKFHSRILHYQNPHFELLPNLLLTVDATQLEATSTKPQKPATSPARAHQWDQLHHENGPLRIWPNFASSNKIAKLDRIGKQSQESSPDQKTTANAGGKNSNKKTLESDLRDLAVCFAL